MLIINNIANVSTTIYEKLKAKGKKVDFYQPITNAMKGARLRLLANRLLFPLTILLKSRSHSSIYIHYAYFASMVFFTKKDLVIHCHGTDVRENLSNKYRKVTLRALTRAKLICYATPDLKQYFPDRFLEKTIFVPNPINTKKFFPLIESADGENINGVSVFFISKLDKTKGADKFLPLVEYLCEQPNVNKITLFRHGNAMPNQLPEHNKLVWLEETPYEEMPNIMREHDIAIGQMALGAIGMSELEALACGLPTIAHFEYNNEYPEPSPLLCARTTEEAKQHLTDLIQNPDLRQQISEKSSKWIVNFHELGKICALLEDSFTKRNINY